MNASRQIRRRLTGSSINQPNPNGRSRERQQVSNVAQRGTKKFLIHEIDETQSNTGADSGTMIKAFHSLRQTPSSGLSSSLLSLARMGSSTWIIPMPTKSVCVTLLLVALLAHNSPGKFINQSYFTWLLIHEFL